MANRLSDQETLEFQFQGTPIDKAIVESNAQLLREELLEAIQLEADLQEEHHKIRCKKWPEDYACEQSPPPLTMEEYAETIQDIFRGNSAFDQLLGGFLDTEPGILVDPIEDFQPVEYHESWVDALVPTLIITIIIAALFLFLRDGIRRLLGRPKQRTGKWGIF